MPPSGVGVSTMAGVSGPLPKAPDVDITNPDSGDDEASLERFLDSYGNVAPNPQNRGSPDHIGGGAGAGGGGGGGGSRPPNTFPGGPGWPPPPYTTPSASIPVSSSAPTPPSESNIYTFPTYITTICLTDKYGSTISTTVITNPTDVHSPDLIEQSESAISYKTVTADNTGTVTDTATIVLSGEATRVVFPQHDKSNQPPPPVRAPPKGRLRDILLGVFLGAGLVLLFVACLFGYRAYKRKRRNRQVAIGNDQSDSEQPREGTPEMQLTGAAVTMPSMANNHIPPPPFPSQSEPSVSSDSQDFVISPNNAPGPPIIINPFSDPTYNSSSGIEDYVVSNGVPLGREPENPFLHPEDPSLDILQQRRPNSVGDFPPEYTTVDGDAIDASGRRIREERFPFGDEALSVRAESDIGSIHNEGIGELIPDYQYDDPNVVADGFRYNPVIPGRLPH
ncbi:hypothetical protein H072_5719 [Dactylellina haptotyla CBS 200.50]|uniref:Uncharacterized protein n=1 Tax=Dactylellina haptotyla (strain CBS 200.50) TaxID=1284197 RepID=S8BYL7_DACHA|nr:hypothetical protein H072_5719 [Dactylellina haptotyla CBS 200.50]